jgi:hypothetical protein
VKKAFAIVFLLLFLFNVGGYYIVFWALRVQAKAALTQRLDAGSYSDDETIELKIPITLPYPIQSTGFERTNGMFEHRGEFYKLVKHKLQNDTLYVICIRDHAQKQLEQTMTEYANLSNDLPGAAGKALNYLGKLLKDYNAEDAVVLIQQPGWHAEVTFQEFSTAVIKSPAQIIIPPPKI